MGIFSKKIRPTEEDKSEIFEEECFNDTLIGPQESKQEEEKPEYFFEGFSYSDGPEDEEEDKPFVCPICEQEFSSDYIPFINDDGEEVCEYCVGQKKLEEPLEEAVASYVKWVQLPNGKWKMWGSATTAEIDPEFLERARKQTGIEYKDAKVSKNGEYPEDVEEKDIEKTHNLEEANYGGAFDIDPEQFFTREELVEFALLVIEHLNESYYTTFEIEDVFISGDNTLHLSLSDNEGNIISTSTKIDMRKIKNPQDLVKKYLYDVVYQLRKEYDEISSSEQMTESRDDNEELFEESDSEPAAEDNAEIILSSYNNYRLIEVTEDDEVYYIVMAPDGSVMTEDFYAWAESEGLDFDSLATSDKVARFADYVDSIKQ